MKLGVLTVAVQNMTLEEAVKYLSAQGVQTLELGTGGYTNKCHLDPDVYLNDDKKIKEVQDLLKAHHMTICALSCHGNAVHPNKEMAAAYNETYEKTVLLAEKMGIDKKTLYTRINGVTCFKQEEIAQLAKILGLNSDKIMSIFFADVVS